MGISISVIILVTKRMAKHVKTQIAESVRFAGGEKNECGVICNINGNSDVPEWNSVYHCGMPGTR